MSVMSRESVFKTKRKKFVIREHDRVVIIIASDVSKYSL